MAVPIVESRYDPVLDYVRTEVLPPEVEQLNQEFRQSFDSAVDRAMTLQNFSFTPAARAADGDLAKPGVIEAPLFPALDRVVFKPFKAVYDTTRQQPERRLHIPYATGEERVYHLIGSDWFSYWVPGNQSEATLAAQREQLLTDANRLQPLPTEQELQRAKAAGREPEPISAGFRQQIDLLNYSLNNDRLEPLSKPDALAWFAIRHEQAAEIEAKNREAERKTTSKVVRR